MNTVHFMDKITEAIPNFASKKCPVEDCKFVGKDKWVRRSRKGSQMRCKICLITSKYLLRHYTIGHRKCDQWLKEALAEKGIEISDVPLKSRAGTFYVKKRLSIFNYILQY